MEEVVLEVKDQTDLKHHKTDLSQACGCRRKRMTTAEGEKLTKKTKKNVQLVEGLNRDLNPLGNVLMSV